MGSFGLPPLSSRTKAQSCEERRVGFVVMVDGKQLAVLFKGMEEEVFKLKEKIERFNLSNMDTNTDMGHMNTQFFKN